MEVNSPARPSCSVLQSLFVQSRCAATAVDARQQPGLHPFQVPFTNIDKNRSFPSENPMLHTVSDLDLRLLRVFLAIVDAGGVSAAQASLGVGQSTLSSQLSTLETRLGFSLCE
ncbi:LysR family transcriptional regulator, partial [Delftia acidovorans]